MSWYAAHYYQDYIQTIYKRNKCHLMYPTGIDIFRNLEWSHIADTLNEFSCLDSWSASFCRYGLNIRSSVRVAVWQWADYIENDVCTGVTNRFSAHERVILEFIMMINKHQNNTRVGTDTVRQESTYITSFLTRHNESINDDKSNDLYTSSVFFLPLTSYSITDDVTIASELWRYHVNNDLTR